MRRLLLAPWALLLALPVVGRADDAADMKALIEKAMKAPGGADNLAKQQAATFNMKGQVHVQGLDIEFKGEISHQYPEKLRVVIEGEVMGTAFKVIQVVNGDKGWINDPQGSREMSKAELAEAREGVNANSVARLVVLRDK